MATDRPVMGWFDVIGLSAPAMAAFTCCFWSCLWPPWAGATSPATLTQLLSYPEEAHTLHNARTYTLASFTCGIACAACPCPRGVASASHALLDHLFQADRVQPPQPPSTQHTGKQARMRAAPPSSLTATALLLVLLVLPATLVHSFVVPTSRAPVRLHPQRSTAIRMMAAATQHVVVGKGRVGEALAEMLGNKAITVGRTEPVPAEGTGPIYIATRNDDLTAVVDKTPPNRRKDLVFMQNGMLEPFLESYGLQDNTQVLVYFAVAKIGEAPTDGVTDLNPEGLTAAHGAWATDLAATLKAAGLSCHVLEKEPFRAAMFEKLIWIAAFMLVGAAHGGITVGEVEKTHRPEVVALIKELKSAVEGGLGVTFIEGVEDRLCAYTRSVAHFPTAVKEFQWRNGFFWDLSQGAVKVGKADPCPTHSAMLKQVGVV